MNFLLEETGGNAIQEEEFVSKVNEDSLRREKEILKASRQSCKD